MRLNFGRNRWKGRTMDKHENGIVDLGDARIETRGSGGNGDIDLQTFQRYVAGGIETDD